MDKPNIGSDASLVGSTHKLSQRTLRHMAAPTGSRPEADQKHVLFQSPPPDHSGVSLPSRAACPEAARGGGGASGGSHRRLTGYGRCHAHPVQFPLCSPSVLSSPRWAARPRAPTSRMNGTCTRVISALGLGHYGSSSSCTRIVTPSGVVIGVGDGLSARIMGVGRWSS